MGFRGRPEKKDLLPSMEDGARTLRKQKAAYVGTQEWVRKRTKRGGTAGISEYLSRQSDDCRAVF